ncbi:MAG: hypothetical protein PHR06_08320 [Candidatus Cloacimonetes bacterium]|nr:hypothetical protein [Candidatus Cloacimonadota bacterium]
MSSQVTIVCPNCGKTGTYQIGCTIGNKTTSGSYGAQCKNCHKSFRIVIKRGEVDSVH